jgi:hypothetical protein
MKGILDIHNLIKEFSTESGYFNYFQVGDQLQIPNSEENEYPLLFLEEPINVSVSKNDTTYNFALITAFPCSTDNDDEIPFLTQHTHSLLLPKLRDFLISKKFTVSNLTATTISKYAEDNISGLRIDLSLNYGSANKCVIDETAYVTALNSIMDKASFVIDSENRLPIESDFTVEENNNFVFDYSSFVLESLTGYIKIYSEDDISNPVFCGLLYNDTNDWFKRYYKSLIHNLESQVSFSINPLPSIKYYKDITV